MSLAKQVHDCTLTGTCHPWLDYNMQVHELIIDLLRNVTSHTALFQCIVMIIAILS